MVALKTYNNLVPERQEEIMAVCLEEFALHEYQAASLSNIVNRLGLAKGSFYRYFENKQSLYFFLLDYCTEIRLKHDQLNIDGSISDFFELMVQHFMAKIRFDQQYPLHSAFLYNVMQEKNNDELGNIQMISKAKVLQVIKPLVAAQKKLRKDISGDTLSFMVLQTQLSITDYISLTHKVDFRKNIRNKKRLYDLPETGLVTICRQFVEILKDGIINPKYRKK
jgi:AcrR family transcriptional regulator